MKNKNKWLKIFFIGATLLVGTSPLMATSNTTLIGEIQYGRIDEVWEEVGEAPGIKVTIKDGYKSAGKVEKILLELEGAIWSDHMGMNIQPYQLENLSLGSIAIMGKGETSTQLNVSIPQDIKEGEEISFMIPMLIRIDQEQVKLHIKPGDESKLIDEESIFIATTSNNKLTCQIGEVPHLQGEGNIAELILSEVNTYAISGETFKVKLKINNKDLMFGTFQYDDMEEYEAYTRYELKPDSHIYYGGGFTGTEEDAVLKVNKERSEAEFVVTAGSSSKIGQVILKNIPIVSKNELDSTEVKVKIESDVLLGSPKEAVVAIITGKVSEDEIVDNAGNNQEGLEEDKENEDKDHSKDKQVISFSIGKSSYTIDHTIFEMDGKPYIEEPGYTMVPVRYVLQALGVSNNAISYKDGKLQFVYEDRKIELNLESPLAKVDEEEIRMATAPKINNGRTYAPVGEIARILGITTDWNSSTKTATFIN